MVDGGIVLTEEGELFQMSAPLKDFDVDVDEGNRRRSDPRNSPRLAQRQGPNFAQDFDDLARKP